MDTSEGQGGQGGGAWEWQNSEGQGGQAGGAWEWQNSEEWSKEWSQPWPQQWRRRGGRRRQQRWREEEAAAAEAEVDESGFDPMTFVGEWLDNLGHLIYVAPPCSAMNGGRARGKGRNRVCYLATLYKPGLPDKRFNISRDRGKEDWTCGNGILVREEATADRIGWKAADGRISWWTRKPPDGPVYFDAPPVYNMPMMVFGNGEEADWGVSETVTGGSDVMFMLPEAATGAPLLDWKALHLPPDDEEEEPHQTQAEEATGSPDGEAGQEATAEDAAPGEAETAAAAMAEDAPEDAAPIELELDGAGEEVELVVEGMPVLKFREFNPSAMEFVPAASEHVVSAPPPAKKKPPVTGEDYEVAQNQDTIYTFFCKEDKASLKAIGQRLIWTLPDRWGTLDEFDQDFRVNSPMFSASEVSCMQLSFFPHGSQTSDNSGSTCTVFMTVGPQKAAMKFEIDINGKSLGEQVCFGRRYIADYDKPFDSSEEHHEEPVVITLNILDIQMVSD